MLLKNKSVWVNCKVISSLVVLRRYEGSGERDWGGLNTKMQVGEISSTVLQYSRVTVVYNSLSYILWRAGREELEGCQYKEVIHVWGDANANYSDLIDIHYIHA
jgi:hypothetical protein